MVDRKAFLGKVRPFIGTDVVKVVTGMRRCGKSVFLEQIKDEIRRTKGADAKIISVSLEDDENQKFLAKGVLHQFVNDQLQAEPGQMHYVFLDEIHDVEEWERCVNSLRLRKNVDIYVTGSNSKLLSGELATYLTGRYIEIKMTPFSFCEFKEAASVAFPDDEGERLFWRYLDCGGVPFLTKIAYDATASKDYLRDLYGAILLKDVVRRKNIRDVDLLDRLVRYVLNETGHTFSARKISDFFKHEQRIVAPETILNYLGACEEAFLLARVKRQDLVGKRILAVDEKFYVTDLGLRRAVIGGSIARDMDVALENVVYAELVRRGYEVTIGRVREKEVDFVCDKDGRRLFVQVAYLMATEEVRAREYGALDAVKARGEKLLLTLDRLDLSTETISHRYLPDWLVAEDVV